MIRSSDIPAFTNWITESTGEAPLGAAARLGAGAGAAAGGVCPSAMDAATAINAIRLIFNGLSS
jgi:hypothetical protein